MAQGIFTWGGKGKIIGYVEKIHKNLLTFSKKGV